MAQFWTVKIAGVSGIGKTTVLERIKLREKLNCGVVTYSSFLKKFGSQELADYELEKFLQNSTGLVVMDDHLEFDNPSKAKNYVRENTRGLVLLDSPVGMLVDRIKNDGNRVRKADAIRLSSDLDISRRKAMELSRDLSLPLLVVPNLDHEVDPACDLIVAFLSSLKS